MKIENNESTGSDSQRNARPVRGRKPTQESRSAEFRVRLIAWRQTPESSRPSLRALAGQLGTTHQMLAYYLDGIDTWHAKEQAMRIRERAVAEGREMTMRECCEAIVLPGLFREIEELRRQAKRGPLDHWQVQTLNLFAKQGFSGAKEILEKCRQMTPQEERQARASETAAGFASAASDTIARIRKEAESGPLSPQNVLRLKFFARRGHPGAKELFQSLRTQSTQ
jgi:hypothetical protein